MINIIITLVPECFVIIQDYKMNFVVGIPCGDSICAPLVEFLVNSKIKNVIIEQGFSVVENRNKITEKFLEEYEQDYLVFLDSDVVPKLEWLELIVKSQLSAVSIPCPIKKKNGLVVTCLNTDTNKWYSYKEYQQTFEKKLKFKETQISGAGCLVVHRKVLKEMAEPRWEWPQEAYATGEDVLFCYKICKLNHLVFSLAGAICSHYKAGIDLSELELVDPPKLEIPKVIHQVWVGPDKVPHEKYRTKLKELHPQWEYILWDEQRILSEGLISKELFEELYEISYGTKKHSKKEAFTKISDIVRYAILEKYGGLYLDVDVYCLKSFDHLLKDNELFVGFEGNQRASGLIGNAVIACVKNHPAMQACIKKLSTLKTEKIKEGMAWVVTGPGLLTKVLAKCENITVYNHQLFYPILFQEQAEEELNKKNNPLFKDSYAIHSWGEYKL